MLKRGIEPVFARISDIRQCGRYWVAVNASVAQELLFQAGAQGIAKEWPCMAGLVSGVSRVMFDEIGRAHV